MRERKKGRHEHLGGVSQLRRRPSGTRLCGPLIPGTHVPGFPLPPLRGWSKGELYCFCSGEVRQRLDSLVQRLPSRAGAPGFPLATLHQQD
jgi:hypothetical protein